MAGYKKTGGFGDLEDFEREAFVKLEGVTKVYHMGEIDIHAVDGMDFEIAKGEFLVISLLLALL